RRIIGGEVNTGNLDACYSILVTRYSQLNSIFAGKLFMASHPLGRNEFGDPANKGNVLTQQEANDLLNDWVKNDRLRLHMQQVAHLMKSWAKEKENLSEEDQWRREMAGLLHDADWDQWPDQHCSLIIEELEKRKVDPEIIHAIASHGPRYFGVDPDIK